jgi:chemotaxis protein MotA
VFAAIGIIVLIVMVFGGFTIAGGSLGPVLAALPLEFMMIGGAALGATLIGNSMHELKLLGGGVAKVFQGPKYTDQDHLDAIALSSKLMKVLRSEGAVALESHVTEPENSALFSEYPRLQKDPVVVNMICDPLTLMVVSSGTLDTHAVEDVIDNAIKTQLHEMQEPEHAIQSLADAFPALGIVAAVLGVIKTMGAISEPPEILGKMIGGALVGTFLGVLLA